MQHWSCIGEDNHSILSFCFIFEIHDIFCSEACIACLLCEIHNQDIYPHKGWTISIYEYNLDIYQMFFQLQLEVQLHQCRSFWNMFPVVSWFVAYAVILPEMAYSHDILNKWIDSYIYWSPHFYFCYIIHPVPCMQISCSILSTCAWFANMITCC